MFVLFCFLFVFVLFFVVVFFFVVLFFVVLFFYFILFFFTVIWSGRLAEIRWYIYISKSQRILCVPFSKTDSGLCIYHLFVRSNLNFLHDSQWITLPTQSCLDLTHHAISPGPDIQKTPQIKNPFNFYKVLTFKRHVSKFEPNRIVNLQIAVI